MPTSPLPLPQLSQAPPRNPPRVALGLFEQPERWDRLTSLVIAGLLVLVGIGFWPALHADFVRWDDPTFVTENPRVQAWTSDNIVWMWTESHGGHYHPLTWMSWALDHSIWGLKPFGFHLTNVLLHAANAVLLFVLLRRLLAAAFDARAVTSSLTLGAAFGAAVFAVHPLRAESVAWVTERRDVLSVLFLLFAAYAYVRAVRPGEIAIASPRWYMLAIVMLILSCLSKAWGMSFFVLMLFLDYRPLGRLGVNPLRWNWREVATLVWQKAAFMVIGVLTAFAAAWAQHGGYATKSLAAWGIQERVVQVLYGLWFYTKSTFVPTDLTPLYQLPVRVDPFEPQYVVAYVFVAAAAVAVLVLSRWWPAFIAGAGIYGVSLGPVLGVLQSGEQFVADRYSYIACMVYAALAAAIVWRILCWAQARQAGGEHDRAKPALLLTGGVCTSVVGALCLLTFSQSTIWTNTETLWSHAITVRPSSQVLSSYATEMDLQGRKAEAIKALAAAVTLNPSDGRAWFVYGNRMKEIGQFTEAARAYEQAAKNLPQAFMGYVNLGTLLVNQMNRPDEGIAALRLAVEDLNKGGRRPLSYGPYVALGNALWRQGKFAESRQWLEKAEAQEETRAMAQKELQLLEEARQKLSAPTSGGSTTP